jgi:hypothetical protein
MFVIYLSLTVLRVMRDELQYDMINIWWNPWWANKYLDMEVKRKRVERDVRSVEGIAAGDMGRKEVFGV